MPSNTARPEESTHLPAMRVIVENGVRVQIADMPDRAEKLRKHEEWKQRQSKKEDSGSREGGQ